MKYLVATVLFCVPILSSAQAAVEDGPAKILSGEQFELSKEAEVAGIDGTLTLLVFIDKSGTVKSAKVVAGPSWPCNSTPSAELKKVRKAVEENVLTARFSPERKDGKPRESSKFVLFAIGNAYRSAVKEREARAATGAEPPPRIIDSGVINGRALRLPAPNHPGGRRWTGAISVSVLIDEEGNVAAAGATGGPWTYQKVVRSAACDAKFSPTSVRGQPVKVSGVITYNFAR